MSGRRRHERNRCGAMKRRLLRLACHGDRYVEIDTRTLPVPRQRARIGARLVRGGRRRSRLSPSPAYHRTTASATSQPTPAASHQHSTSASLPRADLLAFTDDDCTVPADWLAHIEAIFVAYPEVSMAFGELRPMPHDPHETYVPGWTHSESSRSSTESSAVRRAAGRERTWQPVDPYSKASARGMSRSAPAVASGPARRETSSSAPSPAAKPSLGCLSSP